MKPEPLFCDGEDDCDVVDADVFVAVLAALPVFAVAVADVDAFVPLVLSGKPPANAFDAPTTAAPTTSDFNRWRIYCAPQKLYKPKRHSTVDL